MCGAEAVLVESGRTVRAPAAQHRRAVKKARQDEEKRAPTTQAK